MNNPHHPILLVEDNPMDADLTKRSFVRRNLANPVEVAWDGEEALSYIQRWENGEPRPVAILMDVNLPKLNGIEVLRKFQSHTMCKTIPVIFLISSDEDKEMLDLPRLGVTSYIVKPVNFEKFVAAITQVGLRWSALDATVIDADPGKPIEIFG